MKIKVHPKENSYLMFMTLVSFLIYGLFFLKAEALFQANSVIFFMIILLLIANFIGSLLFVGNLKGNSIKINNNQFPEIFAILESHSKKLELEKIPDMYVLQGNGILNAFALRFVQRDYIVVYSDVLDIAYQEGMEAVSFIIGHELGHIKRGHTSFSKSVFLLPAKLIPFLGNAYSRACEYTCDNIGYNLSSEGALHGVLVLAAGKKLYKKINIKELILVSQFDPEFDVSFAEIFSTHPFLIKRIAALSQLLRDTLTPETPTFTSPHIDISQSKEQY